MKLAPGLVTLVLLAIALPARAELSPVVVHPEREPRVFPRRWIELSTHFAGAAGNCAAPCEGVESLGYAAGVTALFRPSRKYAVAVGWDRAWFRWQAENRDSLTVHVTVHRLGMRFYLLDTARFDGWLEASVTQQLWGASGDASTAGAGPGLGTGVGLDVFVWDYVRLGPCARSDLGFQDSGPTSGGGAVAPSSEPLTAPAIHLVFQLGLAVTVTFGPRSQP